MLGPVGMHAAPQQPNTTNSIPPDDINIADPQAAGFTVSPLMSKYCKGGGEESQESLITLVLKADMGGWLAGGHAVNCFTIFLPSACVLAALKGHQHGTR
jgi:hypothetical protein